MQGILLLIGRLTQTIKFDQMKRASGMSLAYGTEGYAVCKSCLISDEQGGGRGRGRGRGLEGGAEETSLHWAINYFISLAASVKYVALHQV